MGNLRDGGLIVIGVSQRDDAWALAGISQADLATYDVDVLTDQINAYVSPFADLDIVIVTHDGKHYLVVSCREFRDTPLVCKKNGPNGSSIVEGRIYVRPPGLARTTAVTNASQVHDLLELAAEKRARLFLEAARRLGVLPAQQNEAIDQYARELGGL